MVTKPEPPAKRAPVSLYDYVAAVREEAAGQLNDRQLAALAEHLYRVPRLSELDLARAKLLLAHLQGLHAEQQAVRKERAASRERTRRNVGP